MIQDGDVVLFHFPRTDLKEGKLRPTLVIKRLPGEYDDWRICMISSRVFQYNEELDEIITRDDKDFQDSGLMTESIKSKQTCGCGERDINW